MKTISNEFTTFCVPSPVKEQIEDFAEYDGLSVSDVCRRSILQTLREYKETTTANKPSAWSV